MYQGTTPVLLIDVEADLTGQTVQVAFRPVTGPVFIKNAPDIEIYPDAEGTLLAIKFSQEETFQIPEGVCQVEIRWIDENGIADRADVVSMDVIGSITKNVLTHQGGNNP